jgi:GntR family transcriptional repressor for pyruvate dehydrogenase complex
VARVRLDMDGTAWTSLEEVGNKLNAATVAAAEIADQVEALIVSKQVPEGARLPSERDLAQLLGTSRPTVSQAIRILVTRGLVESRRGSGAYATPRPQASMAASVNLMLNLNQESVTQLNEFRLWLETTGVVEAIERCSEADIEHGEAALEALSNSAGRTADWMSADTRFHATLVRAARNPYLASIYESVHATLINYEYRAWIDTGTTPAWLGASESSSQAALHEPILAAVRARDAAAARRAIVRHHEVMSDHLARSREQ